MTIKTQVQELSLLARKAKDTNAISALNSIKTAITEAEKNNGNNEITDPEVIKIIIKLIKQRNDSYYAFVKGGNTIKAEEEHNQKIVLEGFLPKQMTDNEIRTACSEIINMLPEMPNINAKIGKTVGEFNKKYSGMANPQLVSEVVKELLN